MSAAAVLITTDARLAKRVSAEIDRQLDALCDLRFQPDELAYLRFVQDLARAAKAAIASPPRLSG